MGLFTGISSLLGKESDYASDYKRYRKAVVSHPHDHGLQFQFIKFCLMNRITKREAPEAHLAEALGLFESIRKGDAFDLQCHYLVGKYYLEEKNPRLAYQTYLEALKRFNQMAATDPGFKADNADQAYSVSLNLMTLQSDPVDPEVEKCFKLIRKSFQLHLKRIQFENERAKPAPDPARVKQLAEEIKRLKTLEDKSPAETLEAHPPLQAKPAKTEPKAEPAKASKDPGVVAAGQPAPKKSLAIPKVAADPHPVQREASQPTAFVEPPKGVSYMAHENNLWLGPYTPEEIQTMGFLKPTTWVCRFGTQLVVQAFEVPDLQPVLQAVPVKGARARGAAHS